MAFGRHQNVCLAAGNPSAHRCWIVPHSRNRPRNHQIPSRRGLRLLTGRSGESRLACGDGRFADQTFAFVKVRFLFADIDDDLWRAGCALVVPPTCWSRARKRTLWQRLATADNHCNKTRACNSKQWAGLHGAADSIG